MQMTPKAILDVAIAAGFPRHVAVTMTAIALRESAGDPEAANFTVSTGDHSLGLWQLNLRDPNVRAAIIKAVPEVATDENVLKRPDANAKAAHALWGGNNKNLDICWYVLRGPAHVGAYDYRGEYEKHLPVAQMAALEP